MISEHADGHPVCVCVCVCFCLCVRDRSGAEQRSKAVWSRISAKAGFSQAAVAAGGLRWEEAAAVTVTKVQFLNGFVMTALQQQDGSGNPARPPPVSERRLPCFSHSGSALVLPTPCFAHPCFAHPCLHTHALHTSEVPRAAAAWLCRSSYAHPPKCRASEVRSFGGCVCQHRPRVTPLGCGRHRWGGGGGGTTGMQLGNKFVGAGMLIPTLNASIRDQLGAPPPTSNPPVSLVTLVSSKDLWPGAHA